MWDAAMQRVTDENVRARESRSVAKRPALSAAGTTGIIAAMNGCPMTVRSWLRTFPEGRCPV